MKLTDEQIKERIWENTLHTCEYKGGYAGRSSLVQLHCIKHDYNFETSYENVGRAGRQHLVCPICKEENQKSFMISCEYCGKEFLITPSDFSQSEHHFCCRECKDAAQRLGSNEKFVSMHPVIIKNYRKLAFNLYPHQCAACGWNEDEDVLEVHHIDEDRKNNTASNLIILCPTCHKKLTTHKYKLVGIKIVKK